MHTFVIIAQANVHAYSVVVVSTIMFMNMPISFNVLFHFLASHKTQVVY